MSNVIPFEPRPNAGGGWTAAERARLSELADRLGADGVKVEVVYGMTDEGDPWCVIKDDQEEVLIHVARINGQFVIHDASADAIQEGETLWSACDRLLGGDWREHRDDVVVSLSARQVQTFIALVVAATFIYDVNDADAAVETVHASPPAGGEIVVAAAVVAAATGEDQRSDIAAPEDRAEQRNAALAPASRDEPTRAPDPAPEEKAVEIHSESETPAEEAPAPAANAEPERVVAHGPQQNETLHGGDGGDTIHGGDGNDSIVGGAGADHLYGGAGDDTLDGGTAPQGAFDVLEGGDGNDQLMLSGSTIAIGGKGADTFVIKGQSAPDGLLGVVMDFSMTDGDKVVFRGKDVAVTSRTDEANIFNGTHGYSDNSTLTSTPTPGERVGVDLDGDGKEDGYLLFGGLGYGHAAPVHDSQNAADIEPAATEANLHHAAAGGEFLLS